MHSEKKTHDIKSGHRAKKPHGADKKKVISVFAALFLLIGSVLAAETIPASEDGRPETMFSSGDTLYFWYSDDSLTEYLTNAAAAYYEEKGTHVIPILRSGLEYLEEINDASVHPSEDLPQMPDLYIVSNDSLEKAYLSGLAAQVKDGDGLCSPDNFPQTALDAVSYQGRYVGYPFYFETSALLYNKTYMDQTEMEVPETIDGILAFADAYDAPEQVEAVFKWDVSDIFYNYYFTGNYMIVGGEAGDDPQQIDIDNEQAKECLQIYQNLNQFFSIDTKEVTYDSVLQDFIDGKIVMTVATSDAVARIETAKEEGQFAYEYGITKMPDLTDSLKGRSLSVTNAIVINGYSEKSEAANDFASFLIRKHTDELYAKTGKLAARSGVSYENQNLAAYADEYKASISMPKLLGTSNYWVQLEICFSRIWQGEDAESLLSELARQISKQLV